MGTKDFEDKKKIYPSDFFSMPHPTAPWVSIQFRKAVSSGGGIWNKNDWEEITLNPSNHFDSFTIEDNGGLQRITLNLFDQNFTKLETVITQSIAVARSANVIKEEGIVSDETGIFEFKIDNNSMINMRIRFGYTYIQAESDRFIDDITFDADFKTRTILNSGAKKSVIRSPWIYFQLLGAEFNLVEAGLSVVLNAFSTVDNFLTRAKMLKKYAIYRDTPKNILIGLKTIIEEASNRDLTLEIKKGNDPEPFENEDGSQEIEINLGGSPDGTRSWRSLKSLFNEICGKVPPRLYTKDDAQLSENKLEDEDDQQKVSKTVQYNYMVENYIDNGKVKAKIIFYYPDPIKYEDEQLCIRTYIWREHGMSIVSEMSVKSQLDFASLNRQIFVRDGNSGKIYAARGSGGDFTREVGVQDVTKALEKDYNIAFVSDVIDIDNNVSSTRGSKVSGMVARQFVHYLNQGVFSGTLTLPGDPFWLFDSQIRPFQYMIRIIIMRPEYIDKDGTLIQESVSYLSGFYVVKTITHTVSNSGYSTVLAIMRWPTE